MGIANSVEIFFNCSNNRSKQLLAAGSMFLINIDLFWSLGDAGSLVRFLVCHISVVIYFSVV